MSPGDQAQVQRMIQQEIMKSNQMAKFNLNTTPSHRHTGKGGDAPNISQTDIIPGLKAEGRISFAQTTTYKVGLTFNPQAIYIQGNVTGALGEKFIVVANAQFGPSYYMQPQSTTSTVIGGPQQKILQSSTYFGIDSGGTAHTVADEGHIVDVEYPLNTIHARVTITGYDATGIYVQVTTLASGWEITLSFTVV